VTALTVGLAAYWLGARGATWFIILVLGYFPTDFVIASMMRLLLPPRLEEVSRKDGWTPLGDNSDPPD
jgi:hypothetical protein